MALIGFLSTALFLFIPASILMAVFMMPRYGFTKLCVKFIISKKRSVEVFDILCFNTLGFLIQALIIALIFNV